MRILLLVFLGAIAGLVGCDKHAKKEKPSQAEPQEPGEPEKKIDIPVDEPLMKAMKSLIASCELYEIGGHMGSAFSCDNDEDWDFYRDYFGASAPLKPAQSIRTVAAALASDDQNLQQIAAGVLLRQFSENWGGSTRVGDVSKEVSALLRKTLPTLHPSLQAKATRATVHATILSGDEAKLDALIASLDKGPEFSTDENAIATRLQNRAWAATTVFLGLKHKDEFFAGASGDDKGRWAVAVDAMSGLSMTEAEKLVVCPLVLDIMKRANGPSTSIIRYGAARTLAKCGATSIDSILDLSQEMIESRYFNYGSAEIHLLLCDYSMVIITKLLGSKEQCARGDALLDKVLVDSSMPATSRAQALRARTYGREDDKTRALLKQYENDNSPELAAAAKKELAALK